MNSPPAPDIASLLLALPVWRRPAERHAFIDDLLWQLGSAGVALPWRDPAEAAAAVSARCAGGPARRILGEAIADRGWDGAAALPPPDPQSAGSHWDASPYPGPRPFRIDEAPIFCGRAFETRTLLRRIIEPPPLQLTLLAGGRGCGKTSLAEAGVAAALRAGAAAGLPAGEGWTVGRLGPASATDEAFAAWDATCSPSGSGLAAARRLRAESDRIAALAAALVAKRPAGADWLLIVDDLDELLAPAGVSGHRALLDVLCEAAELPRVHVLATLQSDSLGACIEHPGLRAALNGGGLFTLALPSAAALRRMIAGPLERLRRPLAWTPEQVEKLVAETLDQPAGLLYLAGRLQALYQDAEGRRSAVPAAAAFGAIPDAGARAPGGSDAFFAARAASALDRAGDADGAALPGIFAHLVRTGVRAEPCIGGGVPLAKWQDDERAQRVIAALADDDIGLMAVDDGPVPRVRLAHAGLLEAWPRLRQWVEDRRNGVQLAERIRRETEIWQRQGCPDRLRWSHELVDPARRLLAEVGLLDDLVQDIAIADFLTPEAERLLTEVLCRATDDERREDIGARLARIGDPRPGVLPVAGCPRPRWCTIPGGRVLIDGRHAVAVAPFRLAAYPVTRAQFAAFLTAADGFDNPAWWDGLQRLPIDRGGRTRRGNDPATAVSWHDAMAFCRWLGARLGHPVRLPDEAEWQWAAQSAAEEFVYPWGSDWLPACANTDEAGIGRCIAVGLYPAGQSLQGVHDLAGNTWEWCRGPFNRAAGGQVAARVVRGGSWRVNRGFARADFRLDAMPEDRVGSTGFRVACDISDGG